MVGRYAASDETLGADEDGPSTSKAGSSSSAFRSRRSSVHFTTKDMISVGGDISIHQVSSTEDKSSDNQKAPPTTARSRGGGAKTRDEAKEDETRNVEERLSGQSSHESTAESDRETADQGQSRRGRKKGAKAKKPSKQLSSEATSTTSEGSLKTDEEDGVRQTKRHRVHPREYWHDSIEQTEDHTDTTQVLVAHHDANQNQSTDQSIDQSTDQPTDQSPRGPTPPGKSPSTSSGGARSITSTGSILKVSKNWDKRPKNKKKRYPILYTEKQLRKAYIIKPDEEDGVRRTRRRRVRPLEYWRNERPLYECRKSGGPGLVGIISPGAPEERVSVRSMRQPAKPKGHLPVTPSHISIHASPPVGTSKVCQPTINVVNPDTKQEVAIDAVATSKMLKFTGPSGLPAKPDDAITTSKALSQKAFEAGILTIRPFREKGSQLVRRDTIFYVVRGKVAMTLHETSQILQSGDWFFVPKGNVFNITNLRRDETKLTSCQLKSS